MYYEEYTQVVVCASIFTKKTLEVRKRDRCDSKYGKKMENLQTSCNAAIFYHSFETTGAAKKLKKVQYLKKLAQKSTFIL